MSNAAAILRDVYGPHAAKKIARHWGVATITAKVWLQGRFPESRTNELADKVREQLALVKTRQSEIEQQLGIAEGPRGIDSTSVEIRRNESGWRADMDGRDVAELGRSSKK